MVEVLNITRSRFNVETVVIIALTLLNFCWISNKLDTENNPQHKRD
jgi:hypothetical protein